MIRHVHTLPLLPLLVLLLLPLPSLAQGTSQPKPATWTDLIANLFGRQPRKGGSKPISAICPITPLSVLDTSSTFIPRYKPSFTASLQPTIAWHGRAGGVKIQDVKTKETWIKRTPKSTIGVNQVKYDGKALVPDREYSISFLLTQDARSEVLRHRFRTLPAPEIAQVNQMLSTIELEKKTPNEITFEKALYLSGLDLINDAHALILTMPNPSPELTRAIVAYGEACKETTPELPKPTLRRVPKLHTVP
jgi:hypothetical protein